MRYKELTARNVGYISPETQEKIKNTKILIAGCGMGSVLAEVAARVGFRSFVLVDADTVERHNLNRQAFFDKDVGRKKVDALKDKIMAINPEAEVETIDEFINETNVAKFMHGVDLVLDTVDFLDLPAVVALHDTCFQNKVPVLSAMNVGFGSLAVFFPPGKDTSTPFRKVFGLPSEGSVKGLSYAEMYMKLFERLSPALPEKVVQVMIGVFSQMKDGKPCPAPQLAPGSYVTASLVVTAIVRHLAGEEVVLGPSMMGVSLTMASQIEAVRLYED